ncbi:unnamed protein product, partial [Ectocarpus sp. 13 AM-2016]
ANPARWAGAIPLPGLVAAATGGAGGGGGAVASVCRPLSPGRLGGNNGDDYSDNKSDGSSYGSGRFDDDDNTRNRSSSRGRPMGAAARPAAAPGPRTTSWEDTEEDSSCDGEAGEECDSATPGSSATAPAWMGGSTAALAPGGPMNAKGVPTNGTPGVATRRESGLQRHESGLESALSENERRGTAAAA